MTGILKPAAGLALALGAITQGMLVSAAGKNNGDPACYMGSHHGAFLNSAFNPQTNENEFYVDDIQALKRAVIDTNEHYKKHTGVSYNLVDHSDSIDSSTRDCRFYMSQATAPPNYNECLFYHNRRKCQFGIPEDRLYQWDEELELISAAYSQSLANVYRQQVANYLNIPFEDAETKVTGDQLRSISHILKLDTDKIYDVYEDDNWNNLPASKRHEVVHLLFHMYNPIFRSNITAQNLLFMMGFQLPVTGGNYPQISGPIPKTPAQDIEYYADIPQRGDVIDSNHKGYTNSVNLDCDENGTYGPSSVCNGFNQTCRDMDSSFFRSEYMGDYDYGAIFTPEETKTHKNHITQYIESNSVRVGCGTGLYSVKDEYGNEILRAVVSSCHYSPFGRNYLGPWNQEVSTETLRQEGFLEPNYTPQGIINRIAAKPSDEMDYTCDQNKIPLNKPESNPVKGSPYERNTAPKTQDPMEEAEPEQEPPILFRPDVNQYYKFVSDHNCYVPLTIEEGQAASV